MPPAPPSRLVALDAFRGFVIVAMLLVNNKPATFHPQLDHAHWGGFPTFTDMIFPWFLFMTGCALPYSRASRRAKGVSGRAYAVAVVRRAATLFALGCAIYSGIATTANITALAQGRPVPGPWLSIGLAGVLQPIALAYLIGAAVYELPPRWRWGLTAAGLAGYWAALRFVPLPPVGPAPDYVFDTGAAGAAWSPAFEQFRNLPRYLNKVWLAPLPSPGWLRWLVSGVSFAGLPSAIPTASLVIIGTVAGDVFRGSAGGAGGGRAPEARLGLLAALGGVFVGAGLILHADQPMNKDYWTPAYVLFSSGLGFTALAAVYGMVDLGGRGWLAAPFIPWGMNAIAAYFGSIMVRVFTIDFIRVPAGTTPGATVTLKTWLTEWLRGALPWRPAVGPFVLDGTVGDMVFISAYIGFWWAVMAWLHRRKLYWRV